MKTIPFDLKKFEAGAVAVTPAGGTEFHFVGYGKTGNLICETSKRLNAVTYTLTELQNGTQLLAEPEYVPLTADDLPLNRPLWMRHKKDHRYIYMVTTIHPNGVYSSENILYTYFILFEFWEMLAADGTWVPMRKEKV